MGGIVIAGAQTAPDEPKVEQLDLRGANMVDALKVLTAQTGVQFLIENDDDVAFKKVTLKIGPLSVEDALKYVCEAAGAYYRRDENGVYIVSHTKPEGPKPVDLPPPTIKHTSVKKLKLMHAAPRDVYEKILDINPLKGGMVFDTRVWQGMKDFSDLSSNKPTQSRTPGVQVQQPFNGVAFPVTNSQVLQPKAGMDTAGNEITLPGNNANQLGGGGLGGGGLGGGGFGGQGGGAGGGGGLGGQGGGGRSDGHCGARGDCHPGLGHP